VKHLAALHGGAVRAASARDHDAALRAGLDAHIAKPVDLAALIDRVRALAAARPPLPET
jgi:CheY-like chemotaxis protein